MKFLLALIIIVLGGLLAIASAIFGALMLTSANGPTTGNWIAHYALVYFVPIAIILICIYFLIRTFR